MATKFEKKIAHHNYLTLLSDVASKTLGGVFKIL